MATYTPGQDEDEVIKTISEDQPIDLTAFTTEFIDLKNSLQVLPKSKTVPDQETLDKWNNYIVIEVGIEQANLESRAVLLYNEATAIKDAGLLPAKYEDEYQQLKTFIENL